VPVLSLPNVSAGLEFSNKTEGFPKGFGGGGCKIGLVVTAIFFTGGEVLLRVFLFALDLFGSFSDIGAEDKIMPWV